MTVAEAVSERDGRAFAEAAGGPDAVVGTILLVEDITDRVQLEEQLQISEKMASIGLLAAGVAHEVNTPLTGISSFTQMLLEGADPEDPKTALLEKIESRRSARRRSSTGCSTSHARIARRRTRVRRHQRRHQRRLRAARAPVRDRQESRSAAS